MRLFTFIKRKPKIRGTIGYFGLGNWWLSAFTEQERNYILNKFQPLGRDSNSLISGNITSTSGTAIKFLSGLAGSFYKKDDRYIAYKLISKAEEIIEPNSRILDIHFLYGTKIEIAYKDRDTRQNGLEIAIEACQQQISYSAKAADAFKNEYKDSLPSHKGYKQLAIIREKQKMYDEAIKISENALKEGWAGDWENRIERCNKKALKSS